MKVLLSSVLVLLGMCIAANAAERAPRTFSARLSGFNEVHFSGGNLRSAVSTKGSGSFTATLNNAGDVIDYELSYSGLEGSVTQAHIHFGQPGSVGGIVVWLCQAANKPDPPLDDPKITPICPGPNEGTVKGTITADEVLTVTGQGINAGEFDELVRALRAETAYANVHSTLHGPGEIRGQIRVGGRGKGEGN